jgi:chemosensory pili system protein ChpA (sensor histidine kinase/response regulator)
MLDAIKKALAQAKEAPAAASETAEMESADIATPRARAASALEAALRLRMAWHTGRAEWAAVDLCRILTEMCAWHEHPRLREKILALQQRGLDLLAAVPAGQPTRDAVADLEEAYLAIKPEENDGTAIAAALGLSAAEARAFGLVGSFQPVGLDADEMPLPEPGLPRGMPEAPGAAPLLPPDQPDHTDVTAGRAAAEMESVFRQEALNMARNALPKALLRLWRAQDSLEALMEVRNGFHGIKSDARAVVGKTTPERAQVLQTMATLAEAAEDTIDVLLGGAPDPAGAMPALPAGAFSLLNETVIELEHWLEAGTPPPEESRLLQRLEAMQRKSATARAATLAQAPDPAASPDGRETARVDESGPRLAPASHPLLPTFLSEADRLMVDLHRSLGLLSGDPANEDALTRARIKLHTLKGSAGLIGGEAAHLQTIAHSAENLLELIEEFQGNGALREVPREVIDGVLDAEDALQTLLDDLHRAADGPRAAADTTVPVEVDELARRLDTIAARVRGAGTGGEQSPAQPVDAQVKPLAMPSGWTVYAGEVGAHQAQETPMLPGATEGASQAASALQVGATGPGGRQQGVAARAATAPPAPPGQEGAAGPAQGEEHQVQVALGALEDLAITRDALQELLRDMTAERLELRRNNARLRTLVERVESEVAALRTDVRRTTRRAAEWDVLEKEEYSTFDVLLMQLDEALADLEESDERLRRDLGEARAQVEIQSDTWLRAQRALLDMSMVPLSQMQDRLSHAVRSISRRLHKQVVFTLEGGDLTLDGRIAESLFDPLLHLINNAIDHGIEDDPATRVAAGKPAEGHLTIRGRARGDGISIEVSDDGQGIDPDKVATIAVARGIVSAAAIASMDERERRALIWRPGFSTAPNVTAISGRGIGMKSALDDITSLQGRIDLQSEVGKGTTFTITLPRSLAMLRVEVVREGADLVAVPITQVTATHPITYSDLEHLQPGQSIALSDRTITVFGAHLAGGPRGDGEAGQVLLLEVMGRNGAIVVDDVLGSQYLPVRPAHGYLRRRCGLLGYAIGAGGRILPILDLPTIIERTGETLPVLSLHQQEPRPATVLVVDDSQTVRRALRTLFTRNGYQVLEAADGREALALSARAIPDLILLDMEMPAMDGVEALRALRVLPKGGATVPIFMLTSRQQARHRVAAFGAGATHYFTKPYDQDQLLRAAQSALAGHNRAPDHVAS